MRKRISMYLCFVLLMTLSPLMVGAAPLSTSLTAIGSSQPIPDALSQSLIGGGRWSQFFSGVACGAGIVWIGAGGLSGVGAVAAVMAVSGVVATCAAAFD